MRIHHFALLLSVALAACVDDGNVNHLPDAPVLPVDGAIDAVDATPDAPPDRALAIAFAGTGSGHVTSSPAGISCAANCEHTFAAGTRVTLTAEPEASSVFAGWTGACTGTVPVCELTVEAAASVTARFTLKTYTVMVSRTGPGTGTVFGSGIACGTGCTMTVDHGTQVSLVASPTALSHFIGWGDACAGTGTCALTITADTSISAVFALDDLSLVIARGGNGDGTITSTPAGIACGNDCSEVYTANEMVALTATPAASSTFVGWAGACAGTGACNVTMDAAKTVTGTFALKKYALTVQKDGTGTGAVTSSPAGIACGADCTEDLEHGTQVTLTATASPNNMFAGWSGACSGTNACIVTIDAAKTVTATFTLNTYDLTVATIGDGVVTGPQIACPGDCTGTYSHGAMVTLAQSAGVGYTFAGWGGACSGTGACVVAMTSATSVTATFAINTYDLTIATVGTGTVTAAQIACPGDCTGSFTHGTMVTLAQAAGTGYTFTGWSGACSGTGACVVTMTSANSVTATFTINSYDLTVAIVGSGTVTAPQIACPGDCVGAFDHGTLVTLVATAGTGYTFTGWSGGVCFGTGACVVSMTSANSATATFTLNSYDLTVATVGTGTVTAPQIACPGDCVGTFNHGTMVTLAQSAGTGYTFAGWGGACSGTGACFVTMDAAKTVTATFTLNTYNLTVATVGMGTITGPQIACPGDCTGTFTHGMTVTLAQAAGTGYTFTGWSGACSGTGACVVSMTSANSVTATFTINSYDLTVATVGTGSVTAPQIACPGDCTGTFTHGTLVTLVATAGTGYTFAGWSGACSGTGACVVTMTSANSVTATFTINSYNLTVSTVGSGTITAPQIACPGDCSGTYTHGTMVTLVQAAGTGYTFAGWTGACSGTGACVVTMDAAKTVTATFTLNSYDLTVATVGTGSVTAPQIACPGDCVGTFTHGMMITLAQTAGTGYTFAGWGGACSGTGACVVTMDAAKAVTATFTLNSYDLTVATVGTGSVTAPQIACPGDCTGTFTHGTLVTLAPSAGPGYTFTGWSGACSGTGACVVTMTSANSVTATFSINSYDLTVSTIGTGSVTAPQIACPGDCTGTYPYTTMVTLAQSAGAGYTFTGWSGACSGTGACVVTMTSANSVTATFSINSYDLTVATVGTGSVTAPQIACPGDCTGTYPYATLVTLAQSAGAGYTFTGWTGACSGTGACVVAMTSAHSVTATFTINNYDLTVATVGTGTVTAPQIACPGDCTGTYPYTTMVTLAQTAGAGYTFTGWSGACSGTGACVVTMDAAKSVTATFTINNYDLTVATVGIGTVTAPQIACPGDCTGTYPYTTMVTLAQTAGAGYTFTGWSGACSGTGACVVTMDTAKSVTATFAINSYPLSVGVTGSGSVSSTPAGISCSSGTCNATFTSGTQVTLAQTAGTGYTFAGWGGACSGTGACVVAMTSANSVTATFAVNNYALSVAVSGNGSVSSSPAGISACTANGGTCNATFPYPTQVTLSPSAGAGYNFAGWGGACSGTGACVVTMNAAKNVTASFTLASYTLSVAASGYGSVTSSAGGISCGLTGGSCSATFTYGTMVTLSAGAGGSGSTASMFASWAGACGGMGASCTITITGPTSTQATFALAPNIIFTTSATYFENFGNVSGANSLCNSVASAAGLIGNGPGRNTRFLAFVSSTTQTAASQLSPYSGWARVDGAPVFNTLADLAASNVYNGAGLDEHANPVVPSGVGVGVWTGATGNGGYSNSCTGALGGGNVEWAGDPNTADTGTYGLSDHSTVRMVANATTTCGAKLHLLCLGADRAATVP